jgi:hypothetical protein
LITTHPWPPTVDATVALVVPPTPTPLAHSGDEDAASASPKEKLRSGNAMNNAANNVTTTTGRKPPPFSQDINRD